MYSVDMSVFVCMVVQSPSGNLLGTVDDDKAVGSGYLLFMLTINLCDHYFCD
jgi:hypothetical protein